MLLMLNLVVRKVTARLLKVKTQVSLTAGLSPAVSLANSALCPYSDAFSYSALTYFPL